MSELIPVRITDARPMPGFRPLWAAAPAAVTTSEPVVEATEDRFEEGYRLGFADAEQNFCVERERHAALLAACEIFQPEPSEELALLIAETVEGLVRLAADTARTLYLNPDDLALIDPDALPLVAVPDPDLSRGSLRIEDSAGWVEDGVSIHLDALREQLGLGGERQ